MNNNRKAEIARQYLDDKDELQVVIIVGSDIEPTITIMWNTFIAVGDDWNGFDWIKPATERCPLGHDHVMSPEVKTFDNELKNYTVDKSTNQIMRDFLDDLQEVPDRFYVSDSKKLFMTTAAFKKLKEFKDERIEQLETQMKTMQDEINTLKLNQRCVCNSGFALNGRCPSCGLKK